MSAKLIGYVCDIRLILAASTSRNKGAFVIIFHLVFHGILGHTNFKLRDVLLAALNFLYCSVFILKWLLSFI